MNIEKVLKSKNIVLIVKTKHNISNIEYFRNKIKKSKIIYLSTTHTYEEFKYEYNQYHLNNLYFIDVLTTIKSPPPIINNCIFISYPDSFTEMRIAIETLFNERNFETLIFDNVSELKRFSTNSEIIEFFQKIIFECKTHDKKIVMFCNNSSEALIRDLIMFSDETIWI